MPPGFEGGQLPMIKRLPHQRGFRNRFRVEYQVVNLKALERFDDGAEVSPLELLKVGLVRTLKTPVKILGEGELSKRLVVQANKFSASAKKAIEDSKGTAQVIVEEADAAAATV
jgi:large subunit ribosomal protein L15